MGAYKISIDSITCVKHADPNDSDEVWILALSDGDKLDRYPKAPLATYSMKSGSTWDINGDLIIEFDGCCNLTLYDQDVSFLIEKTDFLGCTPFVSSADDSAARVLSNGDGDGSDRSEYHLSFSWISKP